jgi:hypothetical protein
LDAHIKTLATRKTFNRDDVALKELYEQGTKARDSIKNGWYKTLKPLSAAEAVDIEGWRIDMSVKEQRSLLCHRDFKLVCTKFYGSLPEQKSEEVIAAAPQPLPAEAKQPPPAIEKPETIVASPLTPPFSAATVHSIPENKSDAEGKEDEAGAESESVVVREVPSPSSAV